MSDDTVSVADHLAEFGDDLLARINEDFADAVLLVGRGFGRPDATATRMVGMDPQGVDAVVTDAEGEHAVRVDFAEPATDPSQLTDRLLELIGRAREALGEEGQTQAEAENAEISAIPTWVTSVVAVRDVHPHLREITFGGAGNGLDDFVPNGPDAFVYVLLPPPGRTELTVDTGFSWEQHFVTPTDERAVGAYYTVREWRPETKELVALFVLHGDTGPASAWAGRVQVGDPVGLWGPRTSWDVPTDPAPSHYVLVADETGLPAVAGVLDLLPADASVQVVAECSGPAERQPLPDHPGATVTWVDRGEAGAGTRRELLVDAVRALDWPGDGTYVFGGGESRALTKVRRFVRDEKGLPREAVNLVAYWRFDLDGAPEEPEG